MDRRLFLLFACGSALGAVSARPFRSGEARYAALIRRAESSAAPAGRRVLRAARLMVERREIIRGSCWNWLNTAYKRAGYDAKNRRVIFRSKKSGPYADLNPLRPGDWIFHVNHSYGDIEHSGMFIAWIDRRRHRALMLSYGGENRRQPGRYRPYDITHTYQIIRPGDKR